MSDQHFSIDELSAELKAAIQGIKTAPNIESIGIITQVSDGIVWIYGLSQCGYNEIIEIESDEPGKRVQAFVLNLEEDQIGAVLLGSDSLVKAGAKVHLTGKVFEIPVGTELIGRVIDPLGNPLDGKGQIKTNQFNPVERIAPGVIERQSVKEPLMTGIKAIDGMVPIGRGQRELIIGDRQTGKTAIAVDTIINQHRQKSDVVSIYVAVGQKTSKIARIVDRLKKENAMDKTIIVLTSASDPAALQYLAPYVGTAIGEYFRDNKEHALIIYDDLSKHAWAYRQISLLLRRPPGREAYPGDVFYLHSRLLERSAKMSDERGAGSLTSLPIIETQAGDVSAYIPTNVISITDGQIYLESDLFYQGIRPAISVGLSVSRVGGAAQTKAMKSIAGTLRLDLAQFRELAAFAQFSTDLDPATKARIERGKRITEILKQDQYQPMSLSDQVVVLLAATAGVFDTLPIESIKTAETRLLQRVKIDHQATLKNIIETGKLSDEAKSELIKTSEQVVSNLMEAVPTHS